MTTRRLRMARPRMVLHIGHRTWVVRSKSCLLIYSACPYLHAPNCANIYRDIYIYSIINAWPSLYTSTSQMMATRGRRSSVNWRTLMRKKQWVVDTNDLIVYWTWIYCCVIAACIGVCSSHCAYTCVLAIPMIRRIDGCKLTQEHGLKPMSGMQFT